MADVTTAVEEAADAAKKHWVVFAIFLLIFTAWLLGSDYKQQGAISTKAAKWPIIGPFFFKGTPLTTTTTTTAAS